MGRDRLKANTTTIEQRVQQSKEDINQAWANKEKLLRKVVELENKILGIEDMVLYNGRTIFEITYGKLHSNATKEELVEYDRRRMRIKVLSKRPYNKYYVEQLAKTKKKIKKVQREKTLAKERKKKEKVTIALEDKDYPSTEIMGKPFVSLTTREIAEYTRIVTRAREERRKMELGLPPYDKLKKK